MLVAPLIRCIDVCLNVLLCYRYDFFLVSQSVRQGTVTPTHYNVIWDTTGLKPDHMQRLAYKMCHLYYNWPVNMCYVIKVVKSQVSIGTRNPVPLAYRASALTTELFRPDILTDSCTLVNRLHLPYFSGHMPM